MMNRDVKEDLDLIKESGRASIHEERVEPSRFASSERISIELSWSRAVLMTWHTSATFIRFRRDRGIENRAAAKSIS